MECWIPKQWNTYWLCLGERRETQKVAGKNEREISLAANIHRVLLILGAFCEVVSVCFRVPSNALPAPFPAAAVELWSACQAAVFHLKEEKKISHRKKNKKKKAGSECFSLSVSPLCSPRVEPSLHIRQRIGNGYFYLFFLSFYTHFSLFFTERFRSRERTKKNITWSFQISSWNFMIKV